MTSPVVRDVVVLCWGSPATMDRRAHAIAGFMGVQPAYVSINAAALSTAASIRSAVPRCTCLIVDAETLAAAVDAAQLDADQLRCLATDAATHVFVWGFKPTDRHAAVLRALSSGGLQKVQALPEAGATFHVGADRLWSGQMAGLSLGAADPGRDAAFVQSASMPTQNALILAGGRPFFVRAEAGASQIFFLACRELADLDEHAGRQASPLSWFSRLIPLMMFLRGALGHRVWRNDHPRACFIIDDPLLRNRHGFLEYERLVASMRQLAFSTCIAFIPWNYRRSSDDAVALLSSSDTAPGLCVHGCDHTHAEFETTHAEALRGKAQLALERMQEHHRLSGVPFDDVMVFPQGLFSAEALTALKTAGYLAAVNSTLCPSTTTEGMPLRELLEVAVTRFGDFPLFGRRYPRDIGEFAVDLFLGKPALAVEHHGYFRHGYAALEAFVARLNGLDDRLEWTSLGAICSRACLTRTSENGDVHVRFYTSRFQLTNTGTEARRYVLVRRRPSAGPLPAVSVDGRGYRCESNADDLTIRLSLDPGQTADIRVSPESADSAAAAWRETNMHNAAVRIRRHLCEFRDNHVDTNRVLSAIVATARQARREPAPMGAL